MNGHSMQLCSASRAPCRLPAAHLHRRQDPGRVFVPYIVSRTGVRSISGWRGCEGQMRCGRGGRRGCRCVECGGVVSSPGSGGPGRLYAGSTVLGRTRVDVVECSPCRPTPAYIPCTYCPATSWNRSSGEIERVRYSQDRSVRSHTGIHVGPWARVVYTPVRISLSETLQKGPSAWRGLTLTWIDQARTSEFNCFALFDGE